MNLWTNYLLPTTLSGAQEALIANPVSTRIIAGGSDLLLEIQQGKAEPVQTLVDITRIPELQILEIRADELFIGAGVPVSQIARHTLILHHASAVADACRLIGGPQVRNSATLGGNVSHALPAADGMISLVSMGADVEIWGEHGLYRTPILNIFLGIGKSTLVEKNEILTGFYLPLRKTFQGSAFSRIMRPQGVALPILNMGIWLERTAQIITDIRISVGPSGPTPSRAMGLEDYFRGKPIDSDWRHEISGIVQKTLRFRSSPQRASAEYRYHLCTVLLEEVLVKAWNRAGEMI